MATNNTRHRLTSYSFVESFVTCRHLKQHVNNHGVQENSKVRLNKIHITLTILTCMYQKAGLILPYKVKDVL